MIKKGGINKEIVGLETEFFILDKEGNISNSADKLLSLFSNNKSIAPHVREEVGFSMFEIGSPVRSSVKDLAIDFLAILNKITQFSEEADLFLLPLGCYPAQFVPKMRKKSWYHAQSVILGKDFNRAMKVCGFHFHYTLPKGLLEKDQKSIKRITNSQAKDLFLGMYNLSVAFEPACSTFCQSSPFLDGKFYGKDSRTLAYRDMNIPNEIQGLYHMLPVLGGLPHYELTLEDLRDISSKRKNLYLDLMRSKGIPSNEVVVDSNLRFVWGPLRVNKLGTLEFRGFDMNTPLHLFSIALLIEETFSGLLNENIKPIPSDIGIDEPFKIENDIVYLPPFSIVKSLELLSARYGFENSSVYSYCKAFFDFTRKLSDQKSSKKFKFIKNMLSERKTKSDELLALVKKNGYAKEHVPADFLKYLAIHQADALKKEILVAKDYFSSLY
ncbi:MAG: glutamate-cysteine ligase family protein [Candidatus ainarchaeum sp.]|nr:glutamate-cysteine ligase family protein [Candidatus ainarchaeum sp.]